MAASLSRPVDPPIVDLQHAVSCGDANCRERRYQIPGVGYYLKRSFFLLDAERCCACATVYVSRVHGRLARISPSVFFPGTRTFFNHIRKVPWYVSECFWRYPKMFPTLSELFFFRVFGYGYDRIGTPHHWQGW